MAANSPSTSRTAWFAWLGWVAATITAPFIVSALWGDGVLDSALYGYWESVLWFLPVGTVGAIIAHWRPKNAVGWLMIVAGIGWSVDSLNIASLEIEEVPGYNWRLWLESWVAQLPLGAIFTLLPLIFPTGDVPSRRWRPVLWGSIAAILLITCGSAFAPSVMSNPAMPDSIKLTAFKAIGEVLNPVTFPLIAIAIVLAVASMAWRFRHADYVERQQVKWFLFVIATATAAVILSAVSSFAWFVALLTIVIGMPTAIMIAILRHNLFDIDRLINRSLVYLLVTLTLVATYGVLVIGLQSLLGPLTTGSDLAVAGSTLLVAALFRPVRARAQSTVDRRFYRQKYDARRTLEAFGVTARDAVALDQIIGELTEIVSATMQPAHQSIWLRAPTSGESRT